MNTLKPMGGVRERTCFFTREQSIRIRLTEQATARGTHINIDLGGGMHEGRKASTKTWAVGHADVQIHWKGWGWPPIGSLATIVGGG